MTKKDFSKEINTSVKSFFTQSAQAEPIEEKPLEPKRKKAKKENLDKRVQVLMKESTHEQLSALAKQRGISVNRLINDVLGSFLDNI